MKDSPTSAAISNRGISSGLAARTKRRKCGRDLAPTGCARGFRPGRGVRIVEGRRVERARPRQTPNRRVVEVPASELSRIHIDAATFDTKARLCLGNDRG